MAPPRAASAAALLLLLRSRLLAEAARVPPRAVPVPAEAHRLPQRGSLLAVGSGSSTVALESLQEPQTLADYCKGSPPKVKEGTRVEANWHEFGEFYPGKVTDVNSDDTVDIVYDDGFTEKHFPADYDHVHPLKSKASKAPTDAACEVAGAVGDLKARVGKAQEKIGLWSAGLRAKLAKSHEAPARAPIASAGSAAPAAAPAASPSSAPEPAMTSEELEKLKKELEAVDAEIAEVKRDVEENDKVLKEKGGQGGEGGGGGGKVFTIDDLIAQYKARIAERRRELERLREQRRRQEAQLAHLGAETVKLEDIEQEVRAIAQDVKQIRAKRDGLDAEGKLDPELRHSIDKLLAQAERLGERLHKLVEAQKLAEEQRRALEEAEREAAQASGDAKEAAKARAKDIFEHQEEEVIQAAMEMESELESVGESTDHLDKDVFPHGAKWWRYRYEHSFVEGVLMVFITILMIWWEWLVRWMRFKVHQLSHTKTHSVLATGTMYIHWLECLLGELAACLLVFLTLWALSLWGLFDLFPIYMPSCESLHLPNHGIEYRRLAFDICVVLIFALILFFSLVFSVVHSATEKMRKWAEREESAEECSEDERDEEGGEEGKEDEPPVFTPQRAETRQPSRNVRSTVTIIRQMTMAQDDSGYTNLKEYFRMEMAEMIPDLDLDKFSFWKYLRINVRSTVDRLFMFGASVWFLILATFLVFPLLHRYAHLGYVRIMAFFLAVAAVNMIIMLSVVVAVNRRMDDFISETMKRGQSLNRMQAMSMKFSKKWAFALFTYTLFFLCFGAARTLCQPWMWGLHFWPVLAVACLTALVCLFFVLKLAPVIPTFAASLALPPYVHEADIRRVQTIMAEDTLSAKEYAHN